MIIELRIDVRMNEGLTLRAIRCWTNGGIGLNTVFAKADAGRPDGRVQRVRAKVARSPAWIIRSVTANCRLRKISSPMNLQLTVHLNRKTRSSWKDLPRYPFALAGRNGTANVNCNCVMRNAAFIALLKGSTCKSMIPIAGAANRRLIFMPSPKEYATLPTVNIRRW